MSYFYSTLIRPCTEALEANLNLILNNFKTVKAMSAKFDEFSKMYLETFQSGRRVYVNIEVSMATAGFYNRVFQNFE